MLALNSESRLLIAGGPTTALDVLSQQLVLGVGPVRRRFCHVLPALVGPLFRHAMLRLPGIALALASLGFLGLAASPPAPEWGRVLAEGMVCLERAPWGVIAPAAALGVLAVLSVSVANLSLRRKNWG